MFSIVKSLPSGYSRDLQDLKPSLWKTSSTALESVKIMNGVVKSLNIHKERMEEAASNSYAISLDIAEQLVVKKGMPFRSAHKVVGALVEEAVSKNRSAFTSLQKEDIRTVLRRIESDLHPEELIQIMRQLTPIRSLQLRVSAGSPNPKEQREMISFSFRRLARYREEMSKRKKSVTVAFDKLAKSVESYLNA